MTGVAVARRRRWGTLPGGHAEDGRKFYFGPPPGTGDGSGTAPGASPGAPGRRQLVPRENC